MTIPKQAQSIPHLAGCTFDEPEKDTILELFSKYIQSLLHPHPSQRSLNHTYSNDISNYSKYVVDDGWTVTHSNDVVWEEPGTCEGRAKITRGQYEDFAKGISELQRAITALKERGVELQYLSLQQQIAELEKLKGEMRAKISTKALAIIGQTIVTLLSKGHPLAVGL